MLTNIRNEKLLPCPTVYGNGENVISLCFLRIYGWGFSHSSSICHGGKKKKKKPCCCVVIKVLNATKESTSSSTSVPQLIYEKNDIRL